MIIWGWFRRPIVLGLKTDLCETCGLATQHAILRVTTWAHLFWVPFLLIWVDNRLVCAACGTHRKLGWRQVRAALKSGRLPLPARAGFKAWANRVFEETGRIPAEAAFDPVEANPKRGPWNLWLRVWPVLVGGLIVYGIVVGGNRPAPAAPVSAPAATWAHQCYEAADGSISGCKLSTGTMYGTAQGRPITCYFAEPLPSSGKIYCP